MEDANGLASVTAVQAATDEQSADYAGRDHQDAEAARVSVPSAHGSGLLVPVRSRVDTVRRWPASHAIFPTWLPPTWRSVWVAYATSLFVTVLTSALLTTLSITTHGYVQSASPLLLTDVLVALVFGPGPSLVSALLGIVLIDYFINPPHFAWSHADPAKAITLAVLGLVGCAISLLASRVARARHEAEALTVELRESERKTVRRMDEFLSVASHELKTPLTSILANVQLAARKAQNLQRMMHTRSLDLDALERMPVDLAMLLERTERQARRQDRLVNELLEMSRARSGRLELDLADCDLVALVHNIVDEQQQAHPSRRIEVEVASPASEGLIATADAHRVEQVLSNFLSNALKYSLEDAPVVVTIRSDMDRQGRSWARVAVQDFGPGLSPEEQAQVWDRFYRVPGVSVLSGSGVGLGLGLYIAQEIVERHGGHVGVESTPGAGATFWFALPLAQGQRAPSE